MGMNDSASQLAVQIGLESLPIGSPDGTIVYGVFVPDTWRLGLGLGRGSHMFRLGRRSS
jgi:hypothetical protein